MADQFNIGVRFGGNIDELRAASSQAAAALTGIKNAAGAIPPALSQIGPAAAKAAAGVERLKAGLGDAAGGSFAGINQGAQVAIRSIDSLEAEIEQLEAAIRKSTDPNQLARFNAQIKDLNRQINNLKVVGFETSLSNINKSAAGAANGLGKIKSAAGQAGGTLVDFGRILQDIPFGFVAIQNNIPTLFESFGRLKQTTGSTSTALKAMLSSLTGAGGLGIAISAVSAAATFATVGFGAWEKIIGGSSKKVKEAKDDADEYASSLKSIGSQLAQEATRVSLLVNALQGETLSRKEKAAALKELSSINNEYFGQLKQEEGFIKNLNLAYAAYLANLKNQFAAKALEKQIEKLFDKRLQLETELDTTSFDQQANLEIGKIEARIKELQKSTKGQPVDLFNLTADQKELGQLNNQLVALKQTNFQFGTKGVRDQIAQVDKDINALIARAEQFQKITVKPPPDPKGEKQDEILKRLKDELSGLQKQLEVTNKLREAGILPINRENDALDLQLAILQKLNQIDAREVAIKIKTDLEIDPVLNDLEIQKALNEAAVRTASKIRIPIQIEPAEKIDVAKAVGLDKISPDAFDGVINSIKEAGKRAKEEARKITIDIGAIMQQFVTDAAVGLGESIGNIISGVGDASDIVKSFGSLIGDVLIQLGKFVIQAGVEALALKTAFENFVIAQPALAIAAGIAAVAVGTALKNSFSKQRVQGFAGGVTNFSGGLAVVGERGPELVNLPRGSDVIPNHFLGGGQQIFVQVAGVQRGDDIYFINQRVTRRKQRI